MLESPDYFFRVREIGRLRQTNVSRFRSCHVRAHAQKKKNGGRRVSSQEPDQSAAGGMPAVEVPAVCLPRGAGNV